MATWLTSKEAMTYLKIKSRTTFYRLVNEGKIRPYALSGTDEKRYNQDELDELQTPVPVERTEPSQKALTASFSGQGVVTWAITMSQC